MNRRIGLGIVASLVALLASVSPARAADFFVVSGPGSYVSTYTQAVVPVQVGANLTYINLDAGRHDVVARFDKAPYQCPEEPGLCSSDVPSWCLPPDPSQPWTINPNDNPLPYAPGTCPLFWSQLIGLAGRTPVLGMQYLTPMQTYQFYCTVHASMIGFIVALPNE